MFSFWQPSYFPNQPKVEYKQPGKPLFDPLYSYPNVTETCPTYLLFADLFDADCFFGGFSALGWAWAAWAFAEDFCFGWLFGCGGATCLVSFFGGFFSGFFFVLFVTITVSPVSLLSCSCTDMSCKKRRHFHIETWLLTKISSISLFTIITQPKADSAKNFTANLHSPVD